MKLEYIKIIQVDSENIMRVKACIDEMEGFGLSYDSFSKTRRIKEEKVTYNGRNYCH